MRRKVLARLSADYSARRVASTGLTKFNPVEIQPTAAIRKGIRVASPNSPPGRAAKIPRASSASAAAGLY